MYTKQRQRQKDLTLAVNEVNLSLLVACWRCLLPLDMDLNAR